MNAKVKIVKKKLPHAIAFQHIGDGVTRDIIMKILENEKVITDQISNIQNAVIEIQKS